jgi:PAS domain S-box-containing protein
MTLPSPPGLDGDGAPADHTPEVTRVFLGVADGERRSFLTEWFADREEYEPVDPGRALDTAAFDLCLLDLATLDRHADALRERKRRSPGLLPCLLLVPEGTDVGQRVDAEDLIDELLRVPPDPEELALRLDTLRRLRGHADRLETDRATRRRFRRASEAVGHALFITDTDGTITYLNPAFEEMTGYGWEEAVGETPRILNSGEMPADYYDRLWETVLDGEVWQDEIVNRRRDGDLYWADQTIAPVIVDGEIEEFVAIQSEITERVAFEKDLRTFKQIVERIEDPIMLQDRDGKFRVVNDAVAAFADIPKAELIGRDEFAFMDRPAAEYVARMKRRVIEEERPVRYEISPEFSGQSEYSFSTMRYPHYDADGSLDGTVAICRDVTEIQARDRQLRVIDRVLRHNLRNNLNVIEGFAETIRESATGEIERSAERIVDASEKLSRTADKERQITTFLADPPDTERFDIVPVVESVVAGARERHPEAEIAVDLPAACPVTATSAVDAALTELVENAVVHAERERPSVEIRVTAEGAGVSVAVADDGPGIPEMERKVLTGEADIEPLYHGSGLGLWLVHLIVRHADGTLTFAVSDAGGSVVTLRLPAP